MDYKLNIYFENDKICFETYKNRGLLTHTIKLYKNFINMGFRPIVGDMIGIHPTDHDKIKKKYNDAFIPLGQIRVVRYFQYHGDDIPTIQIFCKIGIERNNFYKPLADTK